MTQSRHQRRLPTIRFETVGWSILSPGAAMRRRKFIGLLSGATAASPLGALAQQRDRPRRIGVLMGFAETDEVWQTYLRVFRERLRDFGWTDGQNVNFEYRFAGESTERTRLAAAELVSDRPDVLFVSTNPAVSALLLESTHDPDCVHLGIRFSGKRLRRQSRPWLKT